MKRVPPLARSTSEGGWRPRWRFGLVLTMLFASALPLRAQYGQPPVAPPAQSEPTPLKEVRFDQRLDAQVSLDLPFRDEGGKPVFLYDYFNGKPVILVLAYFRCPMLCTQVLNGLVESLRNVAFTPGKEFTIVTVSFDARETPEMAAAKKAAYVESYGQAGAADGWHFLTGEQSSIDRLTEAVGFKAVYDPQKDQFAHASGIVVLTPGGKVSRYFYGILYSPRDLRLGLVEASENKIGSPVDQLLLFCFHYDGATGKYAAAAMNLIRLGGAATVLLIVAGVAWAWRREKRIHHKDTKSTKRTEIQLFT